VLIPGWHWLLATSVAKRQEEVEFDRVYDLLRLRRTDCKQSVPPKR
jgi:hypothetical protein